ncbi:alpha-crystallin A chain-like [Euwallacea fornicatus]|uniref:alpha-crystallin A chain-like n=1 Tax=Euwallacea fornicatus TaxID=995702 RepID=UPI00338E20F4
MALLPFLSFDEDPYSRRHTLANFIDPQELHEWPLMLPRRSVDHLRDLRSQLAHFDPKTSLTIDKDHFQANIDVQQFRPEEISVRLLDDRSIKVEAKHEEQQDDHGFISRHFVRRYLLPKDCDSTKLKSKLSSDGILIVSAPKKKEGDEEEGQEIPIMHSRPIFRRPHLWPSHHSERKRKLSSSN